MSFEGHPWWVSLHCCGLFHKMDRGTVMMCLPYESTTKVVNLLIVWAVNYIALHEQSRELQAPTIRKAMVSSRETTRPSRALCWRYWTRNLDDWPDALDGVLFAYNTSRHKSTRYTPFFLLYGRNAVLSVQVSNQSIEKEVSENTIDSTDTAAVQARVHDMIKIRQHIFPAVKNNIVSAQAKQQRNYRTRHVKKRLSALGTTFLGRVGGPQGKVARTRILGKDRMYWSMSRRIACVR